MNELVEQAKAGGEIVVRDPFSALKSYGKAEIGELIGSINLRVDELKAKFDALPDGKIDRDLRKEIEAADDVLKDYEAELPNALVKICGLRGLVVQIHGEKRRIDPLSARGRLRGMIDALTTREDEAKPPEASVRQLMLIEATPSAWKAIDRVLSAAKKDGSLKSAVRVAVTNPKHIDAAAKVIHDVEAEQAKAEAAMGNV